MTPPQKPTDPNAYLMSRLWRRSRIADNGCWEWLGSRDAFGYGRIRVGNTKSSLCHRAAYQTIVGPIPDGLFLDHLCRNPSCWRPDHLQPVTARENAHRSPLNQAAWKAKREITHCPHGHPYDEENTLWCQGKRACRECGRIRHRKRDAVLAGNCLDCGGKLVTRRAKRCNPCHLAYARSQRLTK